LEEKKACINPNHALTGASPVCASTNNACAPTCRVWRNYVRKVFDKNACKTNLTTPGKSLAPFFEHYKRSPRLFFQNTPNLLENSDW